MERSLQLIIGGLTQTAVLVAKAVRCWLTLVAATSDDVRLALALPAQRLADDAS